MITPPEQRETRFQAAPRRTDIETIDRGLRLGQQRPDQRPTDSGGRAHAHQHRHGKIPNPGDAREKFCQQ